MNNIQEKRKLKVSYNKSGAGNISARVILPIIWVRELGLSKELSAITASFDGKKIIIEPDSEANSAYYYLTISASKNNVCITDRSDNAFFKNISKAAVKKEFQRIDVEYIKEWLNSDFTYATVEMWNNADNNDPVMVKYFEIR